LLFSLFKKKCNHKKLTPFSVGNFCPDCGQEIEISWQILRCEHCQNKRKARVILNSTMPEDKFCRKCGTSNFYVEKKERLEFFDIEYAIFSKKEMNSSLESKQILHIWIEKEDITNDILNNIKLIPSLIQKI